jgi:hypothetical protein
MDLHSRHSGTSCCCSADFLLLFLLVQIWNPPQITAAIKNSSSLQQLAALIQQHLDSMNAINLSAAIMNLPKMGCSDSQMYTACVQRYVMFAPGDSTRNLSNVMYALCMAPQAVTQQQQAVLQQQLVPAILAKVSAANAQDASNALYGMAVSGQDLPEEVVQQLVAAFIGQLRHTKPQEVSNVLWAVAKFKQQVPLEQRQQPLGAIIRMLQHAKSQEVSNTLWAVATMGQQVRAQQLQQLLAACWRASKCYATKCVKHTVGMCQAGLPAAAAAGSAQAGRAAAGRHHPGPGQRSLGLW